MRCWIAFPERKTNISCICNLSIPLNILYLFNPLKLSAQALLSDLTDHLQGVGPLMIDLAAYVMEQAVGTL